MRNKQNIFVLLVAFILLFHLLHILYSQRAIFLRAYDVSYWKDRVEHSQWVLPASQRGIGDDGLYAYVGYELARGADPSFLNVDTPPLGKYLMGFSILIFKNSMYYAIFFAVTSLAVFFFLAKRLLNSTLLALSATTLLALDPLLFSQFWKTTLDLLQLFLLLLNMYLLTFIQKDSKKGLLFGLFCGLSLGFFSQVKFPVLLPILFLLDSFYFFFKRAYKEYLLFLFGLVSAILLVYLRYFMLGHSLVDFLRLQKYIFSFYQTSKVEAYKGAIIQALFLGSYPDAISRSVRKVSEWSFLWPVIGVLWIPGFVIDFKKRKDTFFLVFLAMFLLLSILIFSLVPVYPRYLILIVPFLYLLSIKTLSLLKQRIQYGVIFILFIFSFIRAFVFLIPNPNITLENFYYNFSHQYFQDIYEMELAKSGIPQSSRQEFHISSKTLLNQAQVRAIEIKEKGRDISPYSKKGTVKIQVIYKTQNLGAFVEEKDIELVKEDGQWKILWKPNLLLNDYKPGFFVQTHITFGKRGKIMNTSGNTRVEDLDKGYLISVNPQKIDSKKEQSMLRRIAKVSKRNEVELQNAYLEDPIPNTFIPVSTTFIRLKDGEINELLSFPGLKLETYPSRVYRDKNSIMSSNVFYKECCTSIYSSFNYHGVSDSEKEYDKMLEGYDGGDISMYDTNKKRVKIILKKQPKNGKDIIIK